MAGNIKVRFDNKGTKDVPTSHVNLVGGKEGVFATYQEGDIVYLLGGDDGGWWEMGAYHTRWLPGIIKCLQETGRR